VGEGDAHLFFVHVMKTAGTSLKGRLRHAVGPSAVYPDPSDGPVAAAVLRPDHMAARLAARRDEIRVVTGHFPLCATELLDGPVTTFTVLREPVARTLSFLRHQRENAGGAVSLEELYDEPHRFTGLIQNHMVKMFALTLDVMRPKGGVRTPVAFERRHLELAKERLATVDLVGVQERFGPFCDALGRRYELDLGPERHAHRTEPLEVSEALLARIAEDNALDAELYRFARDQLAV
jgi:hypothetical protein